MSAIFGAIGPAQSSLDICAFTRLADTLAHRGKDGSGICTSENAGFGHHLLCTTEESLKENLPYRCASSNLIITSDARLDNRHELLDTLTHSTPLSAREFCDSQLILLAFKKWGKQCVDHIIGDFVFAIWDSTNQELFCARDHIGIRPFFYQLVGGNFIFSSELLSIFAFTNEFPELNMVEIVDYLTFNKEATSNTVYRNVFRLPPASTLSYKDRKITVSKYWQLELQSPLLFASDDDYSAALCETIERAISSRIRTNYPCGVMLSGGLDSSALAVITHKRLHEREQLLHLYSYALPANNPGPETDEREFINILSQKYGLETSFILASDKLPFENLSDYFQTLGHPLNDLFYFVQEEIYNKAKNHGVRVLLTGIGGDLAASYNDKGYSSQLIKQGKLMEWLIFNHKHALFFNSTLTKTVITRLFRALVSGYRNLTKRLLSKKPSCFHTVNPDLFVKMGVTERLRQYKCYPHSITPSLNAHESICMMINSGHFPTFLEDRSITAQKFDIETCHPYFDIRILKFCMQVPLKQFTLNGCPRSLFRRAMQNHLPREIASRKDKQAFIPDFPKRLYNSQSYFNQTLNLDEDIWKIICKKTFSSYCNIFFQKQYAGNFDGLYTVLGFGSVMANFLNWYNRKRGLAVQELINNNCK